MKAQDQNKAKAPYQPTQPAAQDKNRKDAAPEKMSEKGKDSGSCGSSKGSCGTK